MSFNSVQKSWLYDSIPESEDGECNYNRCCHEYVQLVEESYGSKVYECLDCGYLVKGDELK